MDFTVDMITTRVDNVKIVETVLKPYELLWLPTVMYLSKKKCITNNITY